MGLMMRQLFWISLLPIVFGHVQRL
jgi:hypothetical protein